MVGKGTTGSERRPSKQAASQVCLVSILLLGAWAFIFWQFWKAALGHALIWFSVHREPSSSFASGPCPGLNGLFLFLATKGLNFSCASSFLWSIIHHRPLLLLLLFFFFDMYLQCLDLGALSLASHYYVVYGFFGSIISSQVPPVRD